MSTVRQYLDVFAESKTAVLNTLAGMIGISTSSAIQREREIA